MSNESRAQKIVIVGGGFAGLAAAKSLGGHHETQVTLIDRRNYHLFQPLLYQVAMAGLSPAEIAVPIRTILAGYRNVRVLLANVNKIDLEKSIVSTNLGNFHFDKLILACGSQHSYFGHSDWEQWAPGLKTLEQAIEIRRRVLMAYEMAEGTTDENLKKQLLTFVVVGGGPTGVELAGAIGEISRYTLTKDFRNIHPPQSQIILIEAGPRILPTFTAELSDKALGTLAQLGVNVLTSMRVTDVDSTGVRIGEKWIKSHTVLWAAGVQPSELNPTLGMPLDPEGRVIVNADLSLPQHPNIFVLGDQCHFEQDSKILPGLAPIALQQGRHAAKNILRDLKGKKRKTFHYFDKGQMATIGRRQAVLELGRLKTHGFFAWILWLITHIYYLIGFRNRLFVFLEWAWSYVTYHKGARLIVQKDWRKKNL